MFVQRKWGIIGGLSLSAAATFLVARHGPNAPDSTKENSASGLAERSRTPKPPKSPGDRRGAELSRTTLTGNAALLKEMDLFSGLVLDESVTHEWIDFAVRLATDFPEVGFRWLVGLQVTEQTRLAMSVFGRTLSGSNPSLVDKFFGEMISSSCGLRNAFYAGVIEAKSEQSIDEAANILEKVIRDDREKDSLIRGLAGKIHQKGDAQAVLNLAKKYPQQTDPIFLGNALYTLWKADPTAAQEQLDELPQEKYVSEACNLLAYKYGKDQPELAKEWVHSLPEGAVKDSSTAGLARSLSRTDPLTSVELSLSIQDQQLREGALSTLIGPAITKDFDATKGMIAKSALELQDKERWIEFAEKNASLWLSADEPK